MKAMILAAGRGERMRPLTDTTPKPLLPVAEKPLLQFHLEKLAQIGVTDVVINHAWLGEQIEAFVGTGEQFGLRAHYSPEPAGGLETAGGIIRALPMLGDAPFLVINGDIFTDLDFEDLPQQLSEGIAAHLLLVPNPPHNPEGDFGVQDGRLTGKKTGQPSYTFSGMALYSPAFFAQYQAGSEAFVKLRELFDNGIKQRQIAASVLHCQWTDVGTPERLQQLQEHP